MKQRGRQHLSYLIGIALIMSSCNTQETTIPQRKNIDDAVFASGYIEQEKNYTVSAKVDGILLSFPSREGDSVEKNDLIAIIESDVQNNQLKDALVVYDNAVKDASPNSEQLQQIQTQIDQAEEQLEFDRENFARYKSLKEKNSVSQLEFKKVELQLKASENNLLSLRQNYADVEKSLKLNEERSLVQVNTQRSLLKDYKLNTEVSGQVIQVFKKQGELVRRGEAIARIGSGDYIIKLFVSEEDITKVDVGQTVAVNINTYPGESFQGVITKVYPAFDEVEQSYIAEAKFDRLPKKMFTGTQLQANIATNSRQDILVIPTAYLSRGSFVILENGEERKIEIGSKNTVWTEVVAGIDEKDVIVKPENL